MTNTPLNAAPSLIRHWVFVLLSSLVIGHWSLAALFIFAVLGSAAAAEPLRVRVLTYNIRHGEGTDRKLDLPRAAKVIADADPDIASIQEVDQNTTRSGKVDQPAELARLTKMNVAFGANFRFQGGEYGNVVLSRWSIKGQENHKLPVFNMGEQRGMLETEIELPEGHGSIRFLATHFDHRRDERERLESAQAILDLPLKHPAILAGDLNAWPESKTLKLLASKWKRANDQILPTHPAENPTQQIDYILFTPASRWKVVEVKVLDDAVAADHRGLLAVLELVEEK